MPALTPAEKARYRTTPHASQKYLYVFVPTVIFAAEVNNAPAPGVVNIDYDTVTVGAYTVIEGGETLLVGSSAGGSDIGRLRVRGATAGHLIVAWDSDILWSNNQHLTVLREFLPWRRQQRTVAGVVTKDYDVSWTDQTTKWPPAPLMGDATIKLFRPGDPSPQLYMADRGSYAMAPGATITAHAWVMPGGTPATSASSTPGLVTVSAPIKDYWKLSVTDSNGKVSSGRRPSVVVDPANCYTEFVCESLEDNIDGGVVARFRVFGDAPVSAFPSRASIFYFTEDYYGNGHGEHIKFFGYIVERSIKKDPETSDITFTAVSCVSIADKLVVSASELQDVATPSSWQQAKSLTVRRSLFYLIYFHSTLFQVADVDIVDDPTPDWYVVFPEGTLWGLMNTFARTWRALRCGVTKRGRVVIGVDPQMRAVADRGVVTEVMQLQHGDWHGEIDPVITDFPPHAFLDVNGDYYDGVPGVAKELPVLSIAPGHPDKEFGGKDAFPGMVSNGQLESNQFAGLMLGQKNNPYSPFKIELAGNWWEAFEPAFQEYLVAPAGGWPTNAFPALLDSARLIVRGMSQSDAPDGVQLTTLLVEPESFPELAVDGDYPPPFTPPCDDCEIPCVGCDPQEPVPPTVDFVGDPLTGCVPFTVTFTPTIGGGTATGYLWDFGDGAFSTLAAPAHSYTVPGTYTVSLGVDFLEGDYVEATKAAYITAEACTPVASAAYAVVLTDQQGFYESTDFDQAAPGWGQVNTGLPSLGTLQQMVADPLNLSGRQFIRTATAIYRRAGGSWSLVQDAGTDWPTAYAASMVSLAEPTVINSIEPEHGTVTAIVLTSTSIDTARLQLADILAHPVTAGHYIVTWTIPIRYDYVINYSDRPDETTYGIVSASFSLTSTDYLTTVGNLLLLFPTTVELSVANMGGQTTTQPFAGAKLLGNYPAVGRQQASGSGIPAGDMTYVAGMGFGDFGSNSISKIFRTEDGGSSWAPAHVFPDLDDEYERQAFPAVDSSNQDCIFQINSNIPLPPGFSGGSGLLRSIDKGVTFTQLTPVITDGNDETQWLTLSYAHHAFIMAPNASAGVRSTRWYGFGNMVWVGATADNTKILYQFDFVEDGGTPTTGVLTITPIATSGLPTNGAPLNPITFNLVLDPDGTTLYAYVVEGYTVDSGAGPDGQVYVSTNGGVTWTKKNAVANIPLSANGVINLVVAP